MNAQLASVKSATSIVDARTAWMASQNIPAPLQAAGCVVEMGVGREIFAEGGDTETFYKVISGVVRTYRLLSDGRRQIEAFHTSGDVFGFEMGEERSLSAEAVNDCTMICYRRRNIECLAQKDHGVSQHLFRIAMQNLAEAQSHSLLLSRRGAVERVAAFLLAWSRQFGKARLIPLAMTRQDIADYLGLTIETVSRSLSQLERDGVIALPGIREVRLNDIAALQNLAA